MLSKISWLVEIQPDTGGSSFFHQKDWIEDGVQTKWNDWTFLRNITIFLLKFFAIESIINSNPIVNPFDKNLVLSINFDSYRGI